MVRATATTVHRMLRGRDYSYDEQLEYGAPGALLTRFRYRRTPRFPLLFPTPHITPSSPPDSLERSENTGGVDVATTDSESVRAAVLLTLSAQLGERVGDVRGSYDDLAGLQGCHGTGRFSRQTQISDQ